MNIYRNAQQDEHRRWLQAVKRACAHCGQTNYAALRIVDRETGKSVGITMKQWGMSRPRRDALMQGAVVLCATCQKSQRREMA